MPADRRVPGHTECVDRGSPEAAPQGRGAPTPAAGLQGGAQGLPQAGAAQPGQCTMAGEDALLQPQVLVRQQSEVGTFLAWGMDMVLGLTAWRQCAERSRVCNDHGVHRRATERGLG